MNIELTQEEVQQALEEEQAVANEAHTNHINQRVGTLRAAVNRLEAENAELKRQLEAEDSGSAGDDEEVVPKVTTLP
jgi:uncharacterized small protein (DUF1192 family)